jgi:TfoX/Sxy family transcriptional regulator of competence genes
MASEASFVDYVMEQLQGIALPSNRKMFGEYAIYSGSKVVALVCDNQLFVKATAAGCAFIGVPREAPPYKGAKPSFLIQDELDDRAWMVQLVQLTADALPEPKPKVKKVKAL